MLLYWSIAAYANVLLAVALTVVRGARAS